MSDWVVSLVSEGGYPGIALLMFVENLFPPIPSELIMPLAGFTAAGGEIHIVPAVAVGTAGSVAGAVFWYYAGLWLGNERLRSWSVRHGRWMAVTPEDLDRACAWFTKHSGQAVFLGRLVPAIRTLISVPAGITAMGLPRFLLYSTLGTAIWTSALAVAGYALGEQYSRAAEWVGPVSNAVLALLLAAYLYRVITARPAASG